MAENRTLKGIYGEHGAVFERGDTAITGDFCALLIIADAQFHTLKWDELTDTSLSGSVAHADRILAAETDTGTSDPLTIPAGTTLYGQISKFQLHSGSVLAYKAGK